MCLKEGRCQYAEWLYVIYASGVVALYSMKEEVQSCLSNTVLHMKQYTTSIEK